VRFWLWTRRISSSRRFRVLRRACGRWRTLPCSHTLQGSRSGGRSLWRGHCGSGGIALLRKVISPYALSQLTIESVLGFLEPSKL